jgi:hypothetical protein
LKTQTPPPKSQINGFSSLTYGYKNAQTCIIVMLLKNQKNIPQKKKKKRKKDFKWSLLKALDIY